MGEMPPDEGIDMPMGSGACCSDGDCLCHGPEPTALTSEEGPFGVDSYDLAGAGCVYYPTDAEPPFAAVTVSDGFGGTGGCGRSQTKKVFLEGDERWRPLLVAADSNETNIQ